MNVAHIVIFATLVEITIEACKPLLRPVAELLSAEYGLDMYVYLSAALGVLFALLFGVDAVALLTGHAAGPVTQVVTGLVLGRGANFVHDVIDRVGASA